MKTVIPKNFTLIELLACRGVARRAKRSNNFTLIELLVVLAIVGILLGIGLPAFQTLARGQGTTLAARNLAAKLKAARSYAITKRKKVAVLFPGNINGTTIDSGTPNKAFPSSESKYPFSSYRTAVVTGDGPYQFSHWIEGENWNFLPKGTVFLGITDQGSTKTPEELRTHINKGILNSESYDPPFLKTTEVSGINSDAPSLTNAKMRAIVFAPSGQANSSSKMVIDEGTFMPQTITRTNFNSPGLNIYIQKFTGRVSFDEE